jgi:transcriptional regulator
MPKRESPLQSEMLQGTLDMLVLQTLVLGPAHGHTIAHLIERGSEEVLQVEHGSLYPALHRLETRGWIASFWGTSDNNRKAKYYRLTPTGRKQLVAQSTRWDEVVRAIGRIMKPASEQPLWNGSVFSREAVGMTIARARSNPIYKLRPMKT